MSLTRLIQRLNQRRELNRWLKEKRQQRYLADHLNEHLQRDIGLSQQGSERPLRWHEPEAPEREEQAREGKERAGPGSA